MGSHVVEYLFCGPVTHGEGTLTKRINLKRATVFGLKVDGRLFGLHLRTLSLWESCQCETLILIFHLNFHFVHV